VGVCGGGDGVSRMLDGRWLGLERRNNGGLVYEYYVNRYLCRRLFMFYFIYHMLIAHRRPTEYWPS